MTIEEQVKLDIETIKSKKELEKLENDSKSRIEEIELLISQYDLKVEEYISNPLDSILMELFQLKQIINTKSEELEQILKI